MPDQPETPAVDYLNPLSRLGQGKALQEFYEAFALVASDVVATGNAGQVQLTLKLSVRRQGDPEVIIEETIKRTPPSKAVRGAILYALDGALHARDPRQPEMAFRTVGDSGSTTRHLDDIDASVRRAD